MPLENGACAMVASFPHEFAHVGQIDSLRWAIFALVDQVVNDHANGRLVGLLLVDSAVLGADASPEK